jgi:hypothetical protein
LTSHSCPYCQATLPAKAQFCTHCGSRLPTGIEADLGETSLFNFDPPPARTSRTNWLSILLALVVIIGCFVVLTSSIYLLWEKPKETPVLLFPSPSETAPATHDISPTQIITAAPFTPTVTPLAPQTSWAIISDEIYFVALRRSPGYNGKNNQDDISAEIPAGAQVQIISGPQSADNLDWWYIIWNEHEGWVAERTNSGKIILIFASP